MARSARIASRLWLMLALFQALPVGLAAQVARPVLTLDLDSAKVTGGRIPFDEQFELRGKAPKELVQITLIVRPQSQLPLDRCRSFASSVKRAGMPGATTNKPAPGDSATWTRNDGRVMFSLRVGPIEADQEYTLCVRTVTRQADSVTKSIQREAAARVADTIRSVFSNTPTVKPDSSQAKLPPECREIRHLPGPTSNSMLPALREAMIAALSSKIDSAYYLNDSGVYVPYDSAQFRQQFLTGPGGGDLNTLYVKFERAYLNESTTNFACHATQLDSVLRQLRTRLRAVRLDTIGWARESVTPLAQHNLVAAAIAASLPSYTDGDTHLIAWGATPFAGPDMDAPESPIHSPGPHPPRNGAGLAPTRARLDTMALQLRYLIDLAYLAAQANPKSQVDSAAFATLVSTRLKLFQLRDDATVLANALDSTNDAAARLVPAISTFSIADIGLPGSSATTYVERSKDYISADVGLLGAVGFPNKFAGGALQAYVGANFYFVPVNRDAEYGLFCKGYSGLKCVSLTVGLTTGSIARANVRTDLIGSHSLFIGIGFRFFDFFRATLGALIFQSYSNDSRHALRVNGTPAFAVSADWDIRSTFGGLGELLGGK